jgi:hypothetical protein
VVSLESTEQRIDRIFSSSEGTQGIECCHDLVAIAGSMSKEPENAQLEDATT